MTEPNYYNKNGLSPIKAFEGGLLSNDEYIGFCKGNIIKYTIRAGDKNEEGLSDIVKAMDYLQYLYTALELKKEKNRKPKSQTNIHFNPEFVSDDYEKAIKKLKKDIEKYKSDCQIMKD